MKTYKISKLLYNPILGHFLSQIIAFIGVLLIAVACGSIKYVPVETNTVVNYIDSIRIKDTTIYHTQSIVRDYSPDTLLLSGQHSQAKAWADTTEKLIKGELIEEPWKERVVYVDKIVYRDSIKVKEVPVEVEIPVKYIPKWCWIILGILVIELLAVVIKIASCKIL